MLRFNLALHTSTLIILFLFAPKAYCLSWARAWDSYFIALFKPWSIHRLVNI